MHLIRSHSAIRQYHYVPVASLGLVVTMTAFLTCTVVLAGALMEGAAAFTHAPASRAVFRPVGSTPLLRADMKAATWNKMERGRQRQQDQRSTALQMGYNLPPSGGGGGPGSDLKAILPGIVTLIGLTLFFMSPLGGIFFAVTNTLFALAFITPIVGLIGFQIWQAFYTVSGQCPNCGAPVRTLKEDGGQPSLCINCGSLVRTNMAKDGVELCNNPNDVMGGEGSIFDQLFGGGGMTPEQVIDDIGADIGGGKAKGSAESKADKTRREKTIIDVDIESD